ncbi:phospholipase B1, membrane-associated [Xenopus laevis]|uniref:Phospholipase B1, membrane-associated n=2 Tax=Xenopus laevis TaxID=8355 RepID=A0A8J0VE72_XENLA|nr:phospholipase B1, membrane-associated [Xenopus laevis]
MAMWVERDGVKTEEFGVFTLQALNLDDLFLANRSRNPALKSNTAEEGQNDAKFLFPCEGNTYRRPDEGATSVHSLNPLEVKVLSTFRSLNLNPDGANNRLQGLERLLQKASRDVESYMSQKLPSASRISPPPQENLLEEAKKLVENLKQGQIVSFANDWKMITIFVTAEDPCDFCNQMDHTEGTIRKLESVLDYLHQELPKTFVSLVDLTELNGLYLSHPSQAELRKSCDCFRKPSDYAKTTFRFSFQVALERLVHSGQYDNKEDFTVALHPVIKMVDYGNLQNLDKSWESYDFQCSVQASPYLNTHRNSPYELLSDMLLYEEKNAQTRIFGSNFTCTDLSPSDTVPTSVHRLKPADFKVIAALGDSITAGNGAGAVITNPLDVVTEYRGLSWSIGGDLELSNVTTIANILRLYNPNIEGFSTGRGSHHLPNSNLNRAVPGGNAEDMLEQSQLLVQRMKTSSKINMAEDWKLLTIFIGGNDLCGICNNPIYYSPENYIYRIQEALDYLQAEVPRLFVNLVIIMDIMPLKELYDDKRTHCPQTIMRGLCRCIVENDHNSLLLETVKQHNKKYQEMTYRLIETGRYDTKEDFAVVVQPFFEYLEIPINAEGFPDRSFMSPDCFHFGEKGHAQSARALWKNMFEPVGQKTRDQSLAEDIGIHCPPQSDPFVKTAQNSNYLYPTIPPDPTHGSKLTCADKSPSNPKPTSVHALRPADVMVVAAIGDSLTAGNGIGSKTNDVLDVLNMYRGLSWSIGGDYTLDRVTTLPNILREFNPLLTGFSTGTGNKTVHNSFLNEAVPGAKAFNLPEQVKALIAQLKEDKRINYNNDWKVITILIGPNDLCAWCSDANFFSTKNFIDYIREALDMLHKEVPRAFVNLVEVMDIYPLREAVLDPRVKCPVLITKMLCPCLLNIADNSQELKFIRDINSDYQHNTQQLIDSGRYDTRDDFTVVLQPFFRNPTIPKLPDGIPDASFMAPDCFHLSQKSHSQMARMLWKNMLEPVGKKTDVLELMANNALSCPTQDQPFLRTYKNSNYNYSPAQPTQPPIKNWGSDLTCQAAGPSSQIPTSVHKLRPADIKVVAALGDSLTAAYGAKSALLIDMATEYRGVSWSIGGDGTLEECTTLPNILKKFNPNIKGFSTGVGKTNTMFNVAIGGSKAENMTSQATTLVNKMKESTVINFQEDWKVITIFIGANDLCQFCHNRDRYSLYNHVTHLKNALDILYKEIPRVFVNLVEVLEVEGLRRVKADSFGCTLLKPNLCPCFINPREGSPELYEIKKFNKELQSQVVELAEKYQDREDFAAVVQPFFKNSVLPVDKNGDADLSFFSVDCFHFSERGQSEMAIGLWNSMLEPVGQKQEFNNFTHDRSKLKCPTQDQPYLFTLKNSGLPETVAPVPEEKEGQVPYWSVIVGTIGGLAVGCAIVGVAMSMTNRKKMRKLKSPFENGSSF